MQCTFFIHRKPSNCQSEVTYLFTSGPCPSCGTVDPPQQLCSEHASEAMLSSTDTFCQTCGHTLTAEEMLASGEVYMRVGID